MILKKLVQCAVRNLCLINGLAVRLALKNARLIRLTPLKEKKPVYDISVEDKHEFFANGILVSNSTVYWRAGMDRFGSMESPEFILPKGRDDMGIDNSPYVDPATNRAIFFPPIWK